MADPIIMPALHCPFARRQSPYMTQAESAVLDWLKTSGFTAGSDQLHFHLVSLFGHLAARTYAAAASVEHLILAAKWLAWLNVYDDQYLDEPARGVDPAALADIMIATLDTLTPPHVPPAQVLSRQAAPEPILRTLRALLEETMRYASHVQMHRLVHDLITALYAACLEASSWHATRRVPDVAEYRITRQYSGAVFFALSLVDIVSGYEVPHAEFARPEVRTLRASAANVITWSNDLFSCFKEAQRGKVDINLPVVFQHHGLTLQEALNRTAELHNEEIYTYLGLEEQALPGASPELVRYLEGLRIWMQGNHCWSLESGRFGLSETQIRQILGA